MQPSVTTRCGSIAIIGRANVGKSTLLNEILGEKLSITSEKPQTTRQQIIGIKTQGNIQCIYIDTPGFHKPTQRRLSREMVRSAVSALASVDVIGFVVEVDRWTDADMAILERLKQQNQPVILIINKIDKIKHKIDLLPYLQQCSEKMAFLAIVPLSAQSGDNVAELEKIAAEQLPLAEFCYPADQCTQHSRDFWAAECIREKLMRALYQELPYWLTVLIERFEEQSDLIRIAAVILTERPGQKTIIIGKKGELLKKIGTEARLDMQHRFGKKVYLHLWVKIKAGWSEEESLWRNQ